VPFTTAALKYKVIISYFQPLSNKQNEPAYQTGLDNVDLADHKDSQAYGVAHQLAQPKTDQSCCQIDEKVFGGLAFPHMKQSSIGTSYNNGQSQSWGGK
jgi:hypothetical protein